MKNTNAATILIVDDNAANILALENLLEEDNRVILHATSGQEALRTTLKQQIDLIILDVQMPVMDGFEVAQILQSNHRTSNIPIIFATAVNKEKKFMMQGYSEGAIDYLFKPLDPDIVKAKVAVLLKIQAQQKELVEKNASLQKSALLINNSADIIAIVDAYTLEIEEINNAFAELTGYLQAEAYDKTITSFLLHEDRTIVEKAAASKEDRLSFETRIQCKDKKVKCLQWKVVVKDGKWFVNARDITEAKQAEKIRSYLATVVKQSRDAIYIHDHEANIISWNEGAENIYGYTEEEALQMKIWNIIPDYMENEIENILNNILNGEKVEVLETKRVTKHGKLIDVLFSASMINGSKSDLKTIAIMERDITERKLADQRIRQLNADLQANILQLGATNQELESFSYSVSHDLRAPLRALSGYSKILEEDSMPVLDDKAKRILKKIQSNAVKMGVLIDELLAFSRLGKKEVRKSRVNMNGLVQHVISDMDTSASRPVSIAVGDMPVAYADPMLLSQVWVNLLSNAIKYSGKKKEPKVEIGADVFDEGATYYIRDNGSGFDIRYADKLFGVFQRLHSQQEFEGTGVGLAIVHRIITKHGGKVWADSKLNEGATFYFTLPTPPEQRS